MHCHGTFRIQLAGPEHNLGKQSVQVTWPRQAPASNRLIKPALKESGQLNPLAGSLSVVPLNACMYRMLCHHVLLLCCLCLCHALGKLDLRICMPCRHYALWIFFLLTSLRFASWNYHACVKCHP